MLVCAMTLSGGGAPHSAEVLGGVRVSHQRRVVAPRDRAVQGGPDALVGLRAGDDQPADLEVGEHRLEVGVLERVAVASCAPAAPTRRGWSSSTYCQACGPRGSLVVGVLHPDHRHLLRPGLVDEGADVGDDPVALVRLAHDAVLHVDDEQRGPRPTGESGHGVLRPFGCLPATVGRATDSGGRGPRSHARPGRLRAVERVPVDRTPKGPPWATRSCTPTRWR